MIEALFNQPNYLAAKKTLDAVALRQEAINNNLANLETPGYKRVDLSSNFEQELMRMNQNAVTNSLETQMVTNMLAKMRMAIKGQ